MHICQPCFLMKYRLFGIGTGIKLFHEICWQSYSQLQSCWDTCQNFGMSKMNFSINIQRAPFPSILCLFSEKPSPNHWQPDHHQFSGQKFPRGAQNSLPHWQPGILTVIKALTTRNWPLVVLLHQDKRDHSLSCPGVLNTQYQIVINHARDEINV